MNNQLLASDNFASGSLAAGWSAVPGQSVCQVVAGPPNFTEANSLLTVAGQIWTGLTWPNDQASEVTVTMTGSAVATTLIQLHVRNQGGASYSGYRATIKDSGAWDISVVTAGVATVLTSGTGAVIAANDVWVFQAVGAELVLYQNFTRIDYFHDTTYTSGTPGYSQEATNALTTNKVYSWRGYNAIQQDGIWAKQGIAVPGISGSFPIGPADPSKVFFGASVLSSGNVYYMWFSDGPQSASAQIWYAESTDGKTWTRSAAAVLSAYMTPAVILVGSTYYMYVQAGASAGKGDFACYTSTDRQTWTQQSITVIARGTAGQWDDDHLWAFVPVAIIGGTWYGLYSAGRATSTYYFSIGLATSTDGLTWTKYGSNPVLANFYAGQAIVKVGTIWYAWGGAVQLGSNSGLPSLDPNQCIRYQSTDLINWTNPVNSIHVSQLFESVNMPSGQSYINGIIDIGGKAYAYSTSAIADAPPDANGLSYQIGLQIAAGSIAQIVTAKEDAVSQIATDAFGSGAGDLSANWTTPTNYTKLKIVAGPYVQASATNTSCSMLYTGATFSADQYAEITIQTLATSYATPVVRGQLNAQSQYQISNLGNLGSQTGVQIVATVAGVNITIGKQISWTLQVGDVIRLSVITGSDGFPVLSLFQNGFLIAQVQDQNNYLSSGAPGMSIYTSTLANAQISNFNAGNANVIPAYSGGGSSSWLTVAQANSRRGIRH